ncbi:unnamed protein product, partial [Brassica oleracea]
MLTEPVSPIPEERHHAHTTSKINFEVFSQCRPGFRLWLPFCVMVRETKTHFGNDNDGDDKPDDNTDLAKVETGGNVQQTTPDTGTVPNGEKPKTPSAEAASKAVKKARVDKSPQFYVFNNAMTFIDFCKIVNSYSSTLALSSVSSSRVFMDYDI